MQVLIDYFDSHKDFVDRMKYYCNFRQDHPSMVVEIENTVAIPAKFGKYYTQLGPEKLKSISYKEINIKECINKVVDTSEELRETVFRKFSDITRITRSDAKNKLQEVYDLLGLKKNR